MQKLINNKVFRYTWKTIKTIISIFIVLVIGVIITQRVFNNNVAIFGYRIFTVATGSMEPEYKVLDIIFVREVEPDTLKIGDDLVYMGKEGDFQNKIITHRIIGIIKEENNFSFKTKGIANPTEDPIINEDQLFGKVMYKSKVLSFINKIINNPVGFYLLIVLPVAILIFLEILDRFKEKEVIVEEDGKE